MDQRKIQILVGKSGWGKTYLARTLLTKFPRAIVIDQRGEYGSPRFYDFDRLVDFTFARRAGPFRAIWCGGLDCFSEVFHLAFGLQKLVVIVEEADLVEAEGYYREAIYRGREPAEISIVALAQRPHQLSPDLRSQATDIWAFNNSEPTTLQWLRAYFPDQIHEFPRLPKLHGFHFDATASGESVSRFHLPGAPAYHAVELKNISDQRAYAEPSIDGGEQPILDP